MSENFEEMQFTPANGQPRITVVKGCKVEEIKEEEDTKLFEILKKSNLLTTRIKLMQVDLTNLIKEHALLSADVREEYNLSNHISNHGKSHFVSKVLNACENDDVSECSNTLSDFENDSDDDSDSDSDAVSDLNDDDRKSCEVVHKIYHINLNFN